MAFNELFTFETTATVDDGYTSPFYVVVGWYNVSGDTTDLDTLIGSNDNTEDNANALAYWRVRVADDEAGYNAAAYQEYGDGDGPLDDVTDASLSGATSAYEELYSGVAPGSVLTFKGQEGFPYFYIDHVPEDEDIPACKTTLVVPPVVVNESAADADDGSVTFSIVESPGSVTGYEFSLDNATWQSSATFSSLTPGLYTGYARKASLTTCNDSVAFEVLAYEEDLVVNFGVKYRLDFDNFREEAIRVDIEEQNYSGSIDTDVDAGPRPVAIYWGRQGDSIYNPIRGSRCVVQLVSPMAADMKFLPIGASNFQKYRVSVYIDSVLEWRGFVLPEEYREQYMRPPYYVQLTAVDGLAYLSNYDFTGTDGGLILGLRKQLDVVRICLNKLSLGLDVRTAVNIYEVSNTLPVATDDPLNDYYVNADAYSEALRQAQGDSPTLSQGEGVLDCLEVLTRVLQPYGATIMLTAGAWQIVSADEVRDTYIRRLYDSAGVYQSNDTYDPAYALNDGAEVSGDADAEAHYVDKGGVVEVVPARGYQKINRVYGLRDSILTGGAFGYSDFIDSSTLRYWSAVDVTVSRKPVSRSDFNYALAIAGGAPSTAGYVQSPEIDINGGASDRLLIRLSYYMNAFVAGTNEDPTVRVQVQYGSYYLVGAAGDAYPNWSTTSSFIDNPVPLDQYRKWQNYEVTTNVLPATGANVLTVRIYQGINPINGPEQEDRVEELLVQDVEVVYLPNGEFGEREDYIEETNAGYITKGDELTLYHLDVPEEVPNGQNIYANAMYLNTDGDGTTAWRRSGYAESVALTDLLLRRVMNTYSAPVQRITSMRLRRTGDLLRPINRVSDPSQAGKSYLPVYLMTELRSGDMECELHEITAADAAVPVSDDDSVLLETKVACSVLLEGVGPVLLEGNVPVIGFPAVPTSPTATNDGPGAQTVDWVDASDNETGFNIYQSTTSGFTPSVGNRIAQKSEDVETHDATGLAGNTTYYYRIGVYNEVAEVFTDEFSETTLNPFVITVKTDNTGTSSNDQFTLPITDSVATTDLDVYLVSDGSLLGTATTGSPTITFPAGAGTYEIAILGTMGGFAFNNGGDKLKITKIDNWGIFNHGDEEGAFYGCANLTLLTTSDTPDLSGSTTLRNFFRNCTSITSINNIDTWDVSTIENFTIMFFGITSLNVSLSTWDVGSGQLFGNIFQSTPFNGDISGWDMSSATNISSMFNLATSFNQDISGWDVSSVTSFASMFQNATSFDQDLSGWDVSAATTFGNMFTNASAFDQDLSDWDVHLAAGRAGGVPTMTNFLSNAGMATANYDLLLNAWDAVDLVDGVSFGAQGINYTTATSGTARTNIISNDSWTITDAGGV